MRIRDDFLPYHCASIDDDEIAEVTACLKSGWLTTGPRTMSFEREFKHYVGCRHAVAVNSGTAALHLALDVIGLKNGDEVLLPTLTFAATAEVVCYFNARPALIDIEPETFNIYPEKIKEYIASKSPAERNKIKAIIPVHFAGLPCDMDKIEEIAATYDLKIIEDAAHALPTLYKGKKVGTIGDITAFSFYANKNITTGEGGMITTDNDEWADKFRILRLHGISKDAWSRYDKNGKFFYDIIRPGYKYNLTDIAASLGIHQLKKSDKFWQRRRDIAKLYAGGLDSIPEVILPQAALNVACGTQTAWHLYVIHLRLEQLTISRNCFVEELKARNIGASVHFMPLHLSSYYMKAFNYKKGDFPVAEDFFTRCISLPIYPKMKNEDIEYVVEAIADIVRQYQK